MKKFVAFLILALVAYYAMSQQPKKSLESQVFIGICACDVCECCE